jgi:2-oxoglutarate dehydrogenase E2 component (dihydrolipoamide succinyltransferase)
VPSPKAGVIEALLVEDGSTITAHLPLIKLAVGAAGAPATAAASAPVAAAAASTPAVAAHPKPTKPVSTTLPEIPPLPKAPVSTTFASQVPVTPLKPYVEQAADINKISGTRAETRVKMSRMRQTVASRLKNAQNTTAMLTTFNEINMG